MASGPYLRFEDEVTALQQEVNKLTTLGVNKIIALGHSGFDTDKEIAKKVRGVDVVIGGHSNTFLFTGTFGNFLHVSSECVRSKTESHIIVVIPIENFLQANGIVCGSFKTWYCCNTNPINAMPDYKLIYIIYNEYI